LASNLGGFAVQMIVLITLSIAVANHSIRDRFIDGN